jgi:hypothetical protein
LRKKVYSSNIPVRTLVEVAEDARILIEITDAENVTRAMSGVRKLENRNACSYFEPGGRVFEHSHARCV